MTSLGWESAVCPRCLRPLSEHSSGALCMAIAQGLEREVDEEVVELVENDRVYERAFSALLRVPVPRVVWWRKVVRRVIGFLNDHFGEV